MALAEVRFSTGRHFLAVADIVVAMEGDKCRDGDLPENLYAEIPADELAQATIGGQPAAGMPPRLVRFFRGDVWNERGHGGFEDGLPAIPTAGARVEVVRRQVEDRKLDPGAPPAAR